MGSGVSFCKTSEVAHPSTLEDGDFASMSNSGTGSPLNFLGVEEACGVVSQSSLASSVKSSVTPRSSQGTLHTTTGTLTGTSTPPASGTSSPKTTTTTTTNPTSLNSSTIPQNAHHLGSSSSWRQFSSGERNPTLPEAAHANNDNQLPPPPLDEGSRQFSLTDEMSFNSHSSIEKSGSMPSNNNEPLPPSGLTYTAPVALGFSGMQDQMPAVVGVDMATTPAPLHQSLSYTGNKSASFGGSGSTRIPPPSLGERSLRQPSSSNLTTPDDSLLLVSSGLQSIIMLAREAPNQQHASSPGTNSNSGIFNSPSGFGSPEMSVNGSPVAEGGGSGTDAAAGKGGTTTFTDAIHVVSTSHFTRRSSATGGDDVHSSGSDSDSSDDESDKILESSLIGVRKIGSTVGRRPSVQQRPPASLPRSGTQPYLQQPPRVSTSFRGAANATRQGAPQAQAPTGAVNFNQNIGERRYSTTNATTAPSDDLNKFDFAEGFLMPIGSAGSVGSHVAPPVSLESQEVAPIITDPHNSSATSDASTSRKQQSGGMVVPSPSRSKKEPVSTGSDNSTSHNGQPKSSYLHNTATTIEVCAVECQQRSTSTTEEVDINEDCLMAAPATRGGGRMNGGGANTMSRSSSMGMFSLDSAEVTDFDALNLPPSVVSQVATISTGSPL